MGEPYFIYKDISSKDMGILVTELPPIIKVNRDINKVFIPGRNGFLTEDFGTYGSVIKSCECTLLDIALVDRVLAWLDRSGEVIFSNQPDRKYQASIMNQIPFSRIIRQWYKFVVVFDCQPFAKMLDNSKITLIPQETMYGDGTIYGRGTHESDPVIKVYGDGTIYLMVNGILITLTNVSEYVTIDSDIMDCFKDNVLKNSDISGDFPKLTVDTNTISWIGSVSKIEIIPNWRWK